VVLNYLQHISGISTATYAFVQKVKGTKAKIFDTRKTTPLYRSLQKYAVLCGGGHNHRLCLDSSILIKDNHIAICGSITKALQQAKANNSHYAKIEIECDTLEQVAEVVNIGVDIIMLDNMSIKQIIEAISIIDNRAIIEASGNISLETIADIAKTGVDMISIGKITHSAPSVDIGLDII
jgi:nicotinate-nucleotide pyrophosphorylase (carboxylating)